MQTFIAQLLNQLDKYHPHENVIGNISRSKYFFLSIIGAVKHNI